MSLARAHAARVAQQICESGALSGQQPSGGGTMTRTTLRRWGIVPGSAVALVFCAAATLDRTAVWLSTPRSAAADTAPLIRPQQTLAAARGRLRPAGGVRRLAGPSRPGAVIGTLHVQDGDWVAAGTVVAVLDGTAAQQAVVHRLDAETRQAATDLRRFEQLHRDGIVSAAECEQVRLRAEVARAELERARAELDASNVRAPVAGRVLTIHTRAGERIGPDGVLDLGNTTEMEVVAEVYETDIGAVRVGQLVTVTASALPGSLSGRVERIGLTVGQQRVFAINPAADTDARIVEVHVRVDDAARAAALTNLQVDAEFGV